MSRLGVFSRQASVDLDEAVSWHLDGGGSAASAGRLLQDVQAAAAKLSDKPLLARRRPDLLPEPYRFWSLPRHRLLLVCDAAEVTPRIVRVLNTSRDLPPLLAGFVQDD